MKFAISFFFCLCATLHAYADAVISFNNNSVFGSPNPSDRLVGTLGGPPLLVGTNWVAQLYFAKGAGAPNSSLVPVNAPPAQFREPTTSAPGTWRGGSRTLPGVNIGDVVSLQVRIWDGARFATWEDAVADGWHPIGASDIFNHLLVQSDPPSPTDRLMVNFRGFRVVFVPEPSIFHLATIAGVTLLVLARRKPRGAKRG